MRMQVVLGAAKPWTYWIAPPLLVAMLALIVVLAVGYYRKVMVPAFLSRLEEEKRRRRRDAGVGEVRPLHRTPAATSRRLAA